MTRTELLPQILKLSDNDQLMIVEAIRNHLAQGIAPVNEAEFRAELDRRVDDAEAHPEDESPLEVVMQRLRSRR